MPIPLGYASSHLARRPSKLVGTGTALVGAASTAATVVWSVHLAQRAQLALIVPTDCGTGRHDAANSLMFIVPFAFIVPTGAWLMSRSAGYGQLVCRCAVWSAVVGWLVSIAFIFVG